MKVSLQIWDCSHSAIQPQRASATYSAAVAQKCINDITMWLRRFTTSTDDKPSVPIIAAMLKYYVQRKDIKKKEEYTSLECSSYDKEIVPHW